MSSQEEPQAAAVRYVDTIEALLRDWRLQRLFAWIILGAVCMALKGFYGVIAGTFILSFMGNSVISWLEERSSQLQGWLERRLDCKLPSIPRKALSLLYIVVVLNILALGTIFTVPQVISSGRYLKQLLLSDNPYVELAGTIHSLIGHDAVGSLETFFSGVLGDNGGPATKTIMAKARLHHQAAAAAAAASASGAAAAASSAAYASPVLSAQLQRLIKGYVLTALPVFNRLLKSSSKIFYHTMLSLLFSFILVFDKHAVSAGVRRLGGPDSMVRFVYREVGPKLSQFGRLVGKSLEAQLLIALWNTLLTSLGCTALGLPGTPFLAVMVFFCSFIPLAGVVMSTLPMCIIALSESGVSKILQVLAMVFGVHMIEAYFLNPQIYSSKLHLHPLLVLVALYVTEHVAGIGALFLAVPITVFAINVLIPPAPDADPPGPAEPAH